MLISMKNTHQKTEPIGFHYIICIAMLPQLQPPFLVTEKFVSMRLSSKVYCNTKHKSKCMYFALVGTINCTSNPLVVFRTLLADPCKCTILQWEPLCIRVQREYLTVSALARKKSVHCNSPVPPCQQLINFTLFLRVIEQLQNGVMEMFRIHHKIRAGKHLS